MSRWVRFFVCREELCNFGVSYQPWRDSRGSIAFWWLSLYLGRWTACALVGDLSGVPTDWNKRGG
jgi:hypothetical protein